MKTANRFSGPGGPYEGLTRRDKDGKVDWTGEVRFVPDKLLEPLSWRKPRRVFVNSMSDLFHPVLEQDYIAQIFAVMALATKHTFQVLTKRPERMATLLNDPLFVGSVYQHAQRIGGHGAIAGTWPLPNVWLGTSVENQDALDKRLPHLKATPATVRFLSCEPLLGPLTFRPQAHNIRDMIMLEETGAAFEPTELFGIHWVICGGESGPGHRPMDPAWARYLRDQCAQMGVAFFYKQGAGFRPGNDRTLDGQIYEEYPGAELPA